MADTLNLQDLLTRVGSKLKITDDAVSKDDFEKEFKGTWISREAVKTDRDILDPLIKKAMGARMGSIETSIKSSAKNAGFELPSDIFKDEDGNQRKLEEVLVIHFDSIKTQVDELKESASKGDSEKLKELTDKLGIATDDNTRLKDLNEKTQTQLTEKDTEHESAMTDFVISSKKTELFHSVNFKDDISDIEKRGFESIIGDLQFSLDDDKELKILNSEGNVFRDDKDIGELSTKDIFAKLAQDEKLLKKSNAVTRQNGQPIIFDETKNDAKKGGVSEVALARAKKNKIPS